MGRKQSNTVDYFPHYVDQGRTVYILRSQFGNNGYAFWYQLLECLCETENHYYDCHEQPAWQYLLARTGVDEETATAILNILVTLQKIDPELWEKRIIWCSNLVRNLGEVYRKRQRPLPQKPSTNEHPVSATENPISATENAIPVAGKQQSRVKQSRVPSKEGPRQARPASKKTDPIIAEIFQEMRTHLGFPATKAEDPIPSYGKEGQAIKRMFSRGFTREAIVECWKSKVSRCGGEFVSMVYVNQDIGKTGKRKTSSRRLSTDQEIEASLKERGA